nr:hypothetical protein [Tanacetum cinerariifolium]
NSLKDNIIFELPPCAAITPNEPVDEDEHLDTIPAMESDEFIKSSVENLIPIPSESEGIPDNMCDVPFHDNSSPFDVLKDQFEDFSDSNDEFSSTDDDSFSIDKIEYVEASPLDSELISSEVIGIVFLEIGGIKDDILLTIQDDILPEKLLNVNLLFKIEALNDNPTPFYDPIAKSSSTSLNSLLEATNNFDNSLPEFTTFSNVLFDAEYESDSSDDQSCSNEDVLEKIFSTPLFDEEIIPMKIDQHHDKVESGLMESLRTHDSSLIISSKIDSLLDEFADDYDSERDVLILEELLDNYSFSLPENKSFHFDIRSSSRPPVKPPDGDISEQMVLIPRLMITSVSNQEKSPD